MGAKLAHQQLQEVVHVDSDVEADNEPEEGGGFQIGSASESESGSDHGDSCVDPVPEGTASGKKDSPNNIECDMSLEEMLRLAELKLEAKRLTLACIFSPIQVY